MEAKMRRLSAICTVALLQLMIFAPQGTAGTVVDGTVLPSLGGTGTVSVLGPGFGIITKEFTSLDSIVLEFSVADDAIPGFGFVNAFTETVTNSTGVDWTDYHFEFVPLAGGDGLYFETQPPQPGPVAHTSSAFGTLDQPNEDTLDWSGGGVAAGGTVDFSFSFYVPDGITSFRLVQYATTAAPVPEPSAALLFAVGFALVAHRTRAIRAS
jgi:hypothetical protein